MSSSSRSGTTYYASITWTNAGTSTISFSWYGQAPVTKVITINCPTASTPSTSFTYSSNTCGDKIITRASNPPSGIGWFWQNTSTGISESYPANTFNATTPGSNVYYLRAKPNCSSTWSSALPTANVTVNPAVTTAPAISGNARFGAGTLTLAGSGAPTGGNYKWYNASNVYQSTGSTYITGLISATTPNYMFASAVSAAGCEGSKTTVNINIYANPVITAPNTVLQKDAQVVLTATTGYDQYTWRNSANDILNISATNTYTVTMADVYSLVVTKTGATSLPVPFTIVDPIAGQNLNYVVSNDVLIPNITNPAQVSTLAAEKVSQSITYFDGLGRPMQSVATQASPLKNDIVTPVKYDQYGRQAREYLPFIATTTGLPENTGRLKETDLTKQFSYYNTANPPYNDKVKFDTAPWAETAFEASPLNRVWQKGAPGSVWQPNIVTPTNAKAIKLEYKVNVDGTNANEEKVKIWTLTPVTLNSKTEYILSSTAYYASGSLYINVTKDEENREVREYTDKLGKVILKKVQEATTAATQTDAHWTLTYYIYDEFERLRFVLQPKFIFRNSSYDILGTSQLKKDMLDSLTFEYRYDERGRMIYKRVPGAKQVEMVYDQWDRLVLSQDGNQRLTTKWSFTKYDVLNRPIITGEFSNANTQSTLAPIVAAMSIRSENVASGNGVGYSLNLTYPTTATINDIYTITYYDDYTYKTNLSLGTAYDAVIPTGLGFTGAVHNRVKNLVTGTKIRVLQSSPLQWLVSATYYDNRYRVLQVIGDDHLNNKNRITNEYYGYTPWITKSLLVHGASLLTSLNETTYDHMGRVKEVWQTMDGQTANRTLVASHKYNEVGALVEKNIHSTNNGTTFLQSNDYRYNIRGWLTHMNNSARATDSGVTNDDSNDLFGMELKYSDMVAINGINTIPQFNGNISAIQWSTNNLVDAPTEKIYGFKYDAVNRLTDANYATKNGSVWTGNLNLFNENLAYDKNGNISTLKRKSSVDNGTTATLIDDLVYKYKGNQLDAVLDNAVAPNKPYGFAETSTLPAGEYNYDANGSMITDQNKGLVATGGGVVYNHLNLPIEVRYYAPTYGQQKIVYTYDAAGTKLRKVAYNSSGVLISRTEYIGGIQYESLQALADPPLATDLKFMSTGEGRVVKEGSNWNYEYFHKDHLGNTRVVYGYQKQVDEYTATMETQFSTKEASQFYNIATRRVTVFNHTTASIDVTIPDKSAETNGNTNKAIGPAKMLQVSAGDRVQLQVFARYQTGTGGNNALISNLASAVTGSFLLNAGEAAHTALTNSVPAQAATITQTNGVPKSYLFYVLFNNSYAFQQAGYRLLTTDALAGHQQMYFDITVPTGGYLYTYVANESNVSAGVSVYYDDFTIVHTRSTPTLQVLQTSDYYPFGLQIAAGSYQKQTTLDNDYLYNGKELQDEHNLGWLDYGARMYDPTLGRFMVQDALSDFKPDWTSYRYAFNNPMNIVDPNGNYEIKVSLSKEERKELRQIKDKDERREARRNLIESKKEAVRGFVNAALSVLNNNSEAKAAFVAFSGIKEDSKEWTNLWTENGKGPKINHDGNMTTQDENGYSQGSKIFMNPTNGFAESVVTIMHEYVHYGDRLSARLEGSASGVKGYDSQMQREALNEAFERTNADPDPNKHRSQSDWMSPQGYRGYYNSSGVSRVEMGFGFEKSAFGKVHMNANDYREFTAKYLNKK